MKLLLIMLSLLISTAGFSADKAGTAKPSNEAATQLDDLIRGELAALKTYDTVLKDTKDEKQKKKLQAIRQDHQDAVNKLSKYVEGKPDLLEDTDSAGAWGGFTKAWTKGASLIGNETALKALRQGEEHGINEYEEALEDENLSAELKKTIKTKMIPTQKKHIETLKTFM